MWGIALTCLEFLFGTLFHAEQLITPELFEGAGPLVQGPDGFGIGFVVPVPTVTPDMHQAHVAQNAEMLGDRRLVKSDGGNDLTDRTLTKREEGEDLPPARFGNGIEGVGSGSRTSHGEKIHSYMGICQVRFRSNFVEAGRKRWGWQIAAF